MKLLVVAGELSGDSHGGEILTRLRDAKPDLELIGVGGPQMAKAGLNSVIPLSELQARGLTEVVRHIPRHYFLLRQLERMMDQERPDAVLLIDYPGFNLRVARAAKERGLPVFFYCGPQLWAWRGGRMQFVSRYVDRMVVLFPFEPPLYERAGVDARFLGHPLVGESATPEEVAALRALIGDTSGQPVVAVMPGSRPGELQRNLPPLLEGIRLIQQEGFKGKFVLPLAPTLAIDGVREQVRENGADMLVTEGAFLPMLKLANLGIVASGTATLEAAMAGFPFVVVYRVGSLTYRIAKRYAYVRHISIVNILADREIVPEVLQRDFTPERVKQVFLELAGDEERQSEMRENLAAVTAMLGEPGAYQRAAGEVLAFLDEFVPRRKVSA